MNCQQVQEELADYSAGFIRGERRHALQAHLATCSKCREHLAQLRALDRLLAGESLEADELLVQRIMAQVREAEIVQKWRRRHLLEGLAPIVPALSLAGAMMVVLLRHTAAWASALSAWEVDWQFLAQPEWALGTALGAAVGLPLLVGMVTWLTTRIAEALT